MTRRDSLTDVSGLAVGHAEVAGGESGCTVILGPFRARVDRRGPATGSRELEALREEHPVPRVDALLLTGGSAFGLAATDGVVEWLEGLGRGYETRVARVPIVPAAVVYDLAPGRPRPGRAEGRRACDAASDAPVAEGRRGAGAGTMVGKLFGIEQAGPGGIGSASMRVSDWTVGALVVVNAVGDVVRDGRVVAGPRAGAPESEIMERALHAVGRGAAEAGQEGAPGVGENTTLAVIATDAPVDDPGLVKIARLASTALARRISPVHTPFDGDLTFALSTAKHGRPVDARRLLLLGLAAGRVLEAAILRAVGAAEN
jgi:L-aminopeptidase/D-esterase-like protein